MTAENVAAAKEFDLAASGYDAARRGLVPCFDDFYGTALELVAEAAPETATILDLGAGTGLLSAMMLDRMPAARLTLLDASSNMLAEARKKLAGRIQGIVEADMTKADLGTATGGPWDAVISSLAIHHLSHEDKRALYGRIFTALRPGGIFVNAEQVLGPTPTLETAYKRKWEAEATQKGVPAERLAESRERRARIDRCATVEDQLLWLRDIGFTDVDCRYKSGCFAVLSARKDCKA